MEQERRLGRGLEDFSHLFLSPATDVGTPPGDAARAADLSGEGTAASPPVICIAADRKVKERASLALNLALGIARRGKRVLLLDADFSHPRLWTRTGSSAHGSILSVISGNSGESPPAECADGVRLITLDVDVSDVDRLDESRQSLLARWFTTAEEEADIVLVAASPNLSRQTIAVLKASRDVVVVTPQNANDMINAYGVIKSVVQVNDEARVGIVSSRIEVRDESEVVFGKMERIVDQFLGKSLHNYGFIPADKQRSLPKATKTLFALGALPSGTVRCVAGISQAILQLNEKQADSPVADNCCSLAQRLFAPPERAGQTV